MPAYIQAVALAVRVAALPDISPEDRKATAQLMVAAGPQWIDGWGFADAAKVSARAALSSAEEMRAWWLQPPTPMDALTIDTYNPQLALSGNLPATVDGEQTEYWAAFRAFMGWDGELLAALSAKFSPDRIPMIHQVLRDLFGDVVDANVEVMKSGGSSGGWWLAAGLLLAILADKVGGRR